MNKIVKHVLFTIAIAIVILFGVEYLSRFYLKSYHTHIRDMNGNIVSMQNVPGNPGKGLKPDFSGRMISNEFNVEIYLDSLGFRKNTITENQNNKEKYKIIILGDSFMFGWGVEYNESFSVILEKHLEDQTSYDIITKQRAIPGIGQVTELNLLKSIQNFHPDLILVGMYIANHISSGNDLIDNLNETYNNKHVSNFKRPNYSNTLQSFRRLLKKHSNLYRFIEIRLSSILIAKLSQSIELSSNEKIMNRAWNITDSLLCLF